MMTQLLTTLLTASLLASAPVDTSALPEGFDLSAIRGIIVQHDGRYPPVDTLARDLVETVTGSQRYENRDAVLWLLAWSFDPQTWAHQPLIKIGNAELRGEIDLDPNRKYFSYSELVAHKHLRELIANLANIGDRKMDPLESKVAGINEKLVTLQAIFSGRVLSVVPHQTEPLGAWSPLPPSGRAGNAPQPIQLATGAWEGVRRAYLEGDATKFAQASTDFRARAAALTGAFTPDAELAELELHYNRFAPFTLAWKFMVGGFVLAGAAMLIKRRWFDGLVACSLLAGFVVLSAGIWMRWELAGRIPASNMYESLLFLGWGISLFAMISIPLFRHRLVPLTASMMGAVSLLLADVLPVDSFIRPASPVLLDTAWMAIHVPTIMVSYSVLALAVLVAHLQLVVMAVSPKSTKLATTIDGFHYWYVHVGSILLTAGIITGSMWAAFSWGRYWGWDPKEVWSLVALLGYLTILHIRIDFARVPGWLFVAGGALTVLLFVLVGLNFAPLTPGKSLAMAGTFGAMLFLVFGRGMFATAAKSIMCFWLIIMTYVGVNYVLGTGLHSYGFGTGAMVFWMMTLGMIDLGFVVLCSAVYLIRRPKSSAKFSFGPQPLLS